MCPPRLQKYPTPYNTYYKMRCHSIYSHISINEQGNTSCCLLQSAVKNSNQVTIITDERTFTLVNTKAGYSQHNEALRFEAKWSNTLPHFPGVLLMAIHCCHQLLNEAEKTIT